MCILSVCPCARMCALVWAESRESSGKAPYPRLILIYVKAMAHCSACTMDWSASGMCQRPVCVWDRDSGQGLGMHECSACTLQSQPLTFATYLHTHSHIRDSWGLTHLHMTVFHCDALQILLKHVFLTCVAQRTLGGGMWLLQSELTRFLQAWKLWQASVHCQW